MVSLLPDCLEYPWLGLALVDTRLMIVLVDELGFDASRDAPQRQFRLRFPVVSYAGRLVRPHQDISGAQTPKTAALDP